MKLGPLDVADVKLGPVQVSKVYLGPIEIWTSGGGGGDELYFTDTGEYYTISGNPELLDGTANLQDFLSHTPMFNGATEYRLDSNHKTPNLEIGKRYIIRVGFNLQASIDVPDTYDAYAKPYWVIGGNPIESQTMWVNGTETTNYIPPNLRFTGERVEYELTVVVAADMRIAPDIAQWGQASGPSFTLQGLNFLMSYQEI